MASNTIILVSAALATGAGLWYLARNGLFKKLEVKEQRFGPYLVLYENYTGPYKNVSSTFVKIKGLAQKEGMDCSHMCGFFFDDPQSTPAEECRSTCALIAKQGEDLKSPAGLKTARTELENHKLVKEHGLKVSYFPESMCKSVEFPFYGMLSILFGVMRCYPKLKDTLEKCKGKGSLEVYNMKSHTMWFTAALDDRDELLAYPVKTKAQ